MNPSIAQREHGIHSFLAVLLSGLADLAEGSQLAILAGTGVPAGATYGGVTLEATQRAIALRKDAGTTSVLLYATINGGTAWTALPILPIVMTGINVPAGADVTVTGAGLATLVTGTATIRGAGGLADDLSDLAGIADGYTAILTCGAEAISLVDSATLATPRNATIVLAAGDRVLAIRSGAIHYMVPLFVQAGVPTSATAPGATDAATATNSAIKMCSEFRAEGAIVAELITIAADQACADGAVVRTAAAIAGTAPDFARTLQVRITIAVNAITAGTLTLTGLIGGRAVTEVMSLITAVSVTRQSTLAYSTLTSAVVAGLVGGGGAGDNISIGVGASYGLVASHVPNPSNFVGLEARTAANVGANPARVAIGATVSGNGIFTPADAPDAARVHSLIYEYDFTPTQAAHTHAHATTHTHQS